MARKIRGMKYHSFHSKVQADLFMREMKRDGYRIKAGGTQQEYDGGPRVHVVYTGAKTNPRRVKLPTKFTMMPVRVNKKGEVQIGVSPAKLGSGGRFAKCVKSVETSGSANDPRAVCASAGRKKYGAKKMASMARAGKKRAS